ncbi:MAG: translation elongation factor Ts [Patescibacteria group bacterium]|nr:translation elongation factor Ts [Patescibacteria group bacterium]
MGIDTKQIVALRQRTGVGLSDCQKALEQSNGDMEKAIEILRKMGALKAAKKDAERTASQGVVEAYLHAGSKVGALVVVNCETDFVERTEGFRQFAHDLAMHVAAANPQYLKPEDIPAEILDKEKQIYRAQVPAGKPAQVVEKILEGKLQQFYRENCLLQQMFIKDDHRTVQQMVEEQVQKTGEKIVIQRFVRFQV